MFRNILIPLGVSDEAQTAVGAAATLAQPDRPHITLLHVIETIQDLASEEIEDFYRILRERAEATLERWSNHLEALGLEVRKEIVVGKRAPEIARLAEELGCDLIILRSHQIDPEAPTEGIGTISHQVAILANCTVLLIK
jgi:nucleotide-binding universal stress UspA family protein